jgi:hypothetical protein
MMNPDKTTHPDLLAYSEGRLNQAEHEKAQQHLKSCALCRQELSQLAVVLEHLDKVVARVKEAYDNPEDLASVVQAAFDPARPEPEFVLNKDDMIYTLSKALSKRISPKSSLAERLGNAVQSLTGMGKEAAGQLSERILSGSQAPMGAPAVRKDATQVEENPDQPTGGGSQKDKKD